MASIEDIVKISPELNKLNKSDNLKRLSQKNSANSEKTESVTVNRHDSAQISSAAIERLNSQTEAIQFSEVVKKAETLDPQELEKIRERIESRYYLDTKVIDKIVDKLAELPNYLQANKENG